MLIPHCKILIQNLSISYSLLVLLSLLAIKLSALPKSFSFYFLTGLDKICFTYYFYKFQFYSLDSSYALCFAINYFCRPLLIIHLIDYLFHHHLIYSTMQKLFNLGSINRETEKLKKKKISKRKQIE